MVQVSSKSERIAALALRLRLKVVSRSLLAAADKGVFSVMDRLKFGLFQPYTMQFKNPWRGPSTAWKIIFVTKRVK